MYGRLDTRYSPVRRSPAIEASFNPAAPRLACVKPVASVHPEPGSNSSLYNIFLTLSSIVVSVQETDFSFSLFPRVIDGCLPFILYIHYI